jgi:hypothetical protein
MGVQTPQTYILKCVQPIHFVLARIALRHHTTTSRPGLSQLAIITCSSRWIGPVSDCDLNAPAQSIAEDLESDDLRSDFANVDNLLYTV